MITLEQLKQSSDRIKKIRPTYEPILDFYDKVFLAQEQSRQDIVLSPIVIEPDLLRIKQKNNLPLIDPSEFLIDVTAAGRLFDTICDLAIKFAPKLSSSARCLKTATSSSSFDLEALFSAIRDNQDAVLQDLAKRLNVPENDLVFLGYTSIAPSIQVCSEQLTPYLTGMPELGKGYCPICGHHPDMAFLDSEGKRHLKCCFCAHEWATKRIGCAFCGNNDPELQHYFFTDEEKEYRVNLCDHCHHYIKVVDLRQMDRAFYPRLEQITTLHLDIKAREKGYIDSGALTNEDSIE
ncbi:formate dehydrogenase accessory protein FdhE [Desulfobacula sp.]|uniref:formate dehydrogenase accessory protein FdhE n=1 Tax=Desulfobacula sp. TaxID=2593537 RepID=UPI0026305851|nr:formate dehydrogenase accessory protein FdhE [Desulfobacula sp.]